MFSGIINTTGEILSIKKTHTGATCMQVDVGAPRSFLRKVRQGASIAVQGICLTATCISNRKRFFTADIIETTYRKTNVSHWCVGKKVNLEHSLSFGAGLDGHIVQGHVTGTATVERIEETDGDTGERYIEYTIDEKQQGAIVDQGSVAVDGVSLTIAKCNRHGFAVGITPYTWRHTTLELLKKGEIVNIETDLFLRAVAQKRDAKIAASMEV